MFLIPIPIRILFRVTENNNNNWKPISATVLAVLLALAIVAMVSISRLQRMQLEPYTTRQMFTLLSKRNWPPKVHSLLSASFNNV